MSSLAYDDCVNEIANEVLLFPSDPNPPHLLIREGWTNVYAICIHFLDLASPRDLHLPVALRCEGLTRVRLALGGGRVVAAASVQQSHLRSLRHLSICFFLANSTTTPGLPKVVWK